MNTNKTNNSNNPYPKFSNDDNNEKQPFSGFKGFLLVLGGFILAMIVLFKVLSLLFK